MAVKITIWRGVACHRIKPKHTADPTQTHPYSLRSKTPRKNKKHPCRGKWQLANSPEEYQHSSAHFYATGKQSAYPVINYMELSDVDLSKLVE